MTASPSETMSSMHHFEKSTRERMHLPHLRMTVESPLFLDTAFPQDTAFPEDTVRRRPGRKGCGRPPQRVGKV